MLYLFGALVLIVQVTCIIQVLRSRRPYWWALIILLFPIIGSILYYVLEIYPGSREERQVRKTVQEVVKVAQPDRDLKKRVEEIEICGSVDNKAALAEECVKSGMTEEAVRLYSSCLAGPYANDPHLKFGIARAYLANRQYQTARDVLHDLQSNHASFKKNEMSLLHARILEGRGESNAALAEYEKLLPVYVGFEAKARYAGLLTTLGHHRQADQVFQEIVQHAQRFGINHEQERQWLELAKRQLSNQS